MLWNQHWSTREARILGLLHSRRMCDSVHIVHYMRDSKCYGYIECMNVYIDVCLWEHINVLICEFFSRWMEQYFFLPLLLLLLLVLLLLGFLRLLNNNIKKGLKERLSQIDYFRQLKNFSPCFQRGRGVGRKHTTKQNNERKRETRQGYFIFRLPAHNNRREH